MNALRAWFSALEPRERRVLVTGVGLGSVLLAYLLVWQPLYGHLTHLRTAVDGQRSTLLWMDQAARQVRDLRAAAQGDGAGLGGQSLLALVDQSARRAGLGGGISRIEPQGTGTVRVWMDNVSFDDLMLWLGQLQNTHGVQAQMLSAERQDNPGRVNVRMTLQGASQ